MDCRGLALADAWRPPAAGEASLVCQAVSRITSPFLATLHQLFPVTRALPPRSYVGSDLVGNLDRRVGGVSNANGTLSTTATELNASAPGWGCGRALALKNNVIIDINTCSANPADSAVKIANQIAANVTARW